MKKNRIIYYSLLIIGLLVMQLLRAQSVRQWKLKDLQAAMSDVKEPTILNFWATFCKPCIAEMPYFQTVADRYAAKGLRLIFVSLDLKEAYPQKIASFAKRLKLTSPVVFLDESNADEFCPAVDTTWSGAIPASLFINPQTGYRKFFEEELSKERLEKEIEAMLRPHPLAPSPAKPERGEVPPALSPR
jgi:thiol-disulfide isomerase/thioredoxin